MGDANTTYRNHHYVPQWYQRRFLEDPTKQRELHYLSLKPTTVTNADGVRRTIPQRRRRPIRDCFVEEDLYTLRLGKGSSTRIESEFFGDIDRRGAKAVEWWSDFQHVAIDEDHLRGLMEFMSSQKLRTPKGLDWLRSTEGATTHNQALDALTQLHRLFSTIWIESIWQLADATTTDTKFIVSDHPVTVFNRECGPRHVSCRRSNDPDIRWHGSQTLFPLGLDRLLILTNRSWVENPYQSARDLRPNPVFFRGGLFNFLDVQTRRELTEQEVLEINFILKSRAYRHIAAAREEWLYPEHHVSKSDWSSFGHGYLLMPDPRGMHAGDGMVLEFEGGGTEVYDMFGLRPWEQGYTGDTVSTEWDSLRRFQSEFRELFGDRRRGRSFSHGVDDPVADCDL